VPYLPIDPHDIGRTYEAIIRVNSQSGKGGVAYLLPSRYALELPRGLQIDFAQRVQAVVDGQGGELTAEEIYELFRASYLDASAAAYVEAEVDGDLVWGVGIRASIVTASLDAVVNAVNRSRLVNAEREAVLQAFERRSVRRGQ
jgi:2-isopropylmalate synthase